MKEFTKREIILIKENKTMKIKYKIGEKVHVFKVDKIGIIKVIESKTTDYLYSVDYLDEGEKKSIWCTGDEIVKASDIWDNY